jgi:hypothetical protein
MPHGVNPFYDTKLGPTGDENGKKIIIKRNGYKMGNSEINEIIAIGSANTCLIVKSDWNDTFMSTEGGSVNIIKYEKNKNINLKFLNKKKNPKLKVGMKLKDIEFNYENDSDQEVEKKTVIKKLENDIVVLNYKGNSSRDKLYGFIEILELDSELEQIIYNGLITEKKNRY